MKGALDAHRALLAASVPHEVVRLSTPVATADELPAALGLELGCLAVRCYSVATGPRAGAGARDRLAAVLVPAGTAPCPALLEQALGGRAVRPARPAEVNAATDCAAGLVCPVDLPPGVELLADAAVARTDVVYVPVGESGLALGIRTAHLLLATGARVTALTSALTPALTSALTSAGSDPEVLDLTDAPGAQITPDLALDLAPDVALDLTRTGHAPSDRPPRAT